MLGPRMAVLDALGAKNDVAIFEHGEAWRLIACGWLHAGAFHLLLNLSAILTLGVGVERAFGPSRTCLLYLLSSLSGALASALFVPGVLSVGASGGCFGFVGAYWADAVLNYLLKHGSVRDAGMPSLLAMTLPSLMAGFTPWVDNWMHLGGALCGACIAILILPQYTSRPPSVYQLRSSGDGGAGGRGSSSVAGNGAGGLHGVMCSPLAATSPLRRRNTMTLHLPPVRQAQQTAELALASGWSRQRGRP